jgi:hypothetical protein
MPTSLWVRLALLLACALMPIAAQAQPGRRPRDRRGNEESDEPTGSGILCAHDGRYDEAEAAFLRAVGADPELVGSYVELGLVYACCGKWSRRSGRQ